jgi:hypothetical protein
MTEIPKNIDEAWGLFNSRRFEHGRDESMYNSFSTALACLFAHTPSPVDRGAVFYGPYNVTFMGPAVWAGIKDELPGHLVDKQVWVTETPPGDRSAAALVIVESPFAGDVEANVAYARAAMRDCLLRGEAPYASHLLYTQAGVLDDDVPEQRATGIEAGLAWGRLASKTVVYTDRGISSGMRLGIERAASEGRGVEYRSLVDDRA